MDSSTDTRSRLLQAAAKVFAEVGFKAATVRQISKEAGVNVAAASYHFGGKDALYAAVVIDFMEAAYAKYPLDAGVPAEATPEQRLAAFIGNFLLHMVGDGDEAWERQGKLIYIEMVEPTAHFGEIVDRCMRPTKDIIEEIMRDLLGPGAGPELVFACAASVIGQCMFHIQNKHILDRLYPGNELTAERAREVAPFIAAFSLGGIERIKRLHGMGGNAHAD